MPEEVISNPVVRQVVTTKVSFPKRLVNWLSVAERAGAIISGMFVLIMMVMTTLDVILRYAFNSPIPGNYELQPLLLIGVVFWPPPAYRLKEAISPWI